MLAATLSKSKSAQRIKSSSQKGISTCGSFKITILLPVASSFCGRITASVEVFAEGIIVSLFDAEFGDFGALVCVRESACRLVP